jgi:glycosyltransferase involved in cell wall biosynthesis
MLILTNFERFPRRWTSETGQAGSGETANTFGDFVRGMRRADLLVINCDVAVGLQLCALFLVCPWLRKPVVAVDFVLRRPRTFRAKTAIRLKKILLRRVDLFVNYFQNITGYEKYYGISPKRSVFVPFKPNIRYRFDVSPAAEGRYILCLGRSMRDYDTFFAAVAKLAWPAAIPSPDFEQLNRHESRFSARGDQLPPNVEILEDDGSAESMFRMLQAARLVALPILKTSLCASGVSTYLNAMLMRKCVILTEGPGASDVLTDQALICPAEDPEALAALIGKAWDDDSLRSGTAEAGYQYALSLGGEPELRQRVIDVICRYFGGRNPG